MKSQSTGDLIPIIIQSTPIVAFIDLEKLLLEHHIKTIFPMAGLLKIRKMFPECQSSPPQFAHLFHSTPLTNTYVPKNLHCNITVLAQSKFLMYGSGTCLTLDF